MNSAEDWDNLNRKCQQLKQENDSLKFQIDKIGEICGLVDVRGADKRSVMSLVVKTTLASYQLESDELKLAIDVKDKALQEVLNHQSNDPDGNHVMWVGESTFLLCKTALTTPAKPG